MEAGVGRVQVKEVVEGTAGKGWIGRTVRRVEGRRDALDASEREERVRDCRMRSQRAQPTTRPNHPFLCMYMYPVLREVSGFRMLRFQRFPALPLPPSPSLQFEIEKLASSCRRNRTEMRSVLSFLCRSLQPRYSIKCNLIC